MICDLCKGPCFKTDFGSSVIITKYDIRTCMNCYPNFIYLKKIKSKNILNYLLKRNIR